MQQTGAGSPEFYGKTAQALVDLVDMDLGLVLLQRDGSWSIAGSAVVSDTISVHYSKTLLNHVVAQRKTFYEDLNQLGGAASSLADLESGVASPIFGLQEDVVGVLYGVRAQQGLAEPRRHRAAWKPNWCNSSRRPSGPTWRGRWPSGRGCSSSSSSRRTWSASSSAMPNCWKAGPTR